MIVFFVFVLIIVLTPIGHLHKFALYLLFLLGIIFLSRVDVWYIMARCLIVLPFALVVAALLPFRGGRGVLWHGHLGPVELSITREGLWLFVNVLVKALLSALTVLVLVSTTKFASILKAMEKFKVPTALTIILSFLYRYLFVLIDEAERMKRARDSRSPGRPRLRQIRAAGSMIGVLFLRTFHRAERIHAAMAARGFTGEVKTLDRFRIRTADILFGGACGVCMLAIFCLV